MYANACWFPGMWTSAYSNTSTVIAIAMNAMVCFEFIGQLNKKIDIGISN